MRSNNLSVQMISEVNSALLISTLHNILESVCMHGCLSIFKVRKDLERGQKTIGRKIYVPVDQNV